MVTIVHMEVFIHNYTLQLQKNLSTHLHTQAQLGQVETTAVS